MKIIQKVSQWWSGLWRNIYAWFNTTNNAKPIPQPELKEKSDKIKESIATPKRRKSDKVQKNNGWKWTELDFLEWVDSQGHEALMRMYQSGSEFPVVMSNQEYWHWNERWIDYINDYVTKWNAANGVVPRKFNGMEE
jgi:hypothetical protein